MKKTGALYLIIALILLALSILIITTLNLSEKDSITEKPVSTTQPSPLTPIVTEKSLPYVAETDDYKVIEKIQKENTWIEFTDIVEDNYMTRYDYEANSIELVVYTQGGLIQYSEQELNKIKEAVETVLLERGVPLNSVKITLRIE